MIFRIRELHFVNINVILCYVGEGELKCYIVSWQAEQFALTLKRKSKGEVATLSNPTSGKVIFLPRTKLKNSAQYGSLSCWLIQKNYLDFPIPYKHETKPFKAYS